MAYLVFMQKNRRRSYGHSGNMLAQGSVRLESYISHALDWLLYPLICKMFTSLPFSIIIDILTKHKSPVHVPAYD